MSKLPFSREALDHEIREGFVNVNRHPTLPLKILNYGPRTQLSWRWNEVTRACRGLIINFDYEVVARPFPKFFTYDQIEDKSEIPHNESLEITDKVDGSLGICYPGDGGPALATRGTFDGEQALVGTDLLRAGITIDTLPTDRTYLFEIVYPGNAVVIDYKGRSFLTMLAVIDNSTGITLPMEDIGFPFVEVYDSSEGYKKLLKEDRPNKEGYVVRFVESDYRLKIKHPWYLAAHRMLRFGTKKSVWKVLKMGEDMEAIMASADLHPELEAKVNGFLKELHSEYSEIEQRSKEILAELLSDPAIQAKPEAVKRKCLAKEIKTYRYKAILFAMLDGKDYSQMIWKLLKPKEE